MRLSKKLSLRASAHTGVAIRSPKHSDFILIFRKTATLKVRIPAVASLPRNDKEFFDTLVSRPKGREIFLPHRLYPLQHGKRRSHPARQKMTKR